MIEIAEKSIWKHKDGEVVEVLQRQENEKINEYYDEDGFHEPVKMVWYRPIGSADTVEPYVRTEKHFLESFTIA